MIEASSEGRVKDPSFSGFKEAGPLKKQSVEWVLRAHQHVHEDVVDRHGHGDGHRDAARVPRCSGQNERQASDQAAVCLIRVP